MAWAGRYLDDTTEAKKYQVVPLSDATTTLLENACDIAEDAVDRYLGGKSITTPVVVAGLATTQQEQLKRAVAKMVAHVLYSQHNLWGVAKLEKDAAKVLLDEFIAEADLSHTTVTSHMGTVNAQEEYVDDWGDPNSTLENMDE